MLAAITKPLFIGAAGTALSLFLSDSGNVNVFGLSMPAALANGLAVAVASGIGEAAKPLVLDKIHQSGTLEGIEMAVLGPALNTAALYGVVLLAGGTPQLLPIATLGVGSSLLGEYAYNAFENRL
jgi:hypothetical protein